LLFSSIGPKQIVVFSQQTFFAFNPLFVPLCGGWNLLILASALSHSLSLTHTLSLAYSLSLSLSLFLQQTKKRRNCVTAAVLLSKKKIC